MFGDNSIGNDEDDQRLYEAELERQIDDLKITLYYKENELDQRGSQQRLATLLQEIRNKIEIIEEEKLQLQKQIQFYHQKLLLADVESEKRHDERLANGDINSTKLFPGGLASKDLNLYDVRGSVRQSLYADDYTDREKMMQAALKQALQEKDSAMRLLIKLLGKEAIQDVMKYYEPLKKHQRRNASLSPWTSGSGLSSTSPHRYSRNSSSGSMSLSPDSFLPTNVTLSERERYYDFLLDALTNPSKHIVSKNIKQNDQSNSNGERIMIPHANSFKPAGSASSLSMSYYTPSKSSLASSHHLRERRQMEYLLGLSRSSDRKYLRSPSSTIDQFGNVKKSPPPKLTESDIMAALSLSP